MHPTDPTSQARRKTTLSIAFAALASFLATAPCTAAAQAPASESIDLGVPSVLSQRGQRLRIAVPFGSAPGARVAATRFTVAAVDVPSGFEPPRADDFVVLMPERRNVVILQSKAPMDASSASIELRVAGQPPARFDVVIPPVRYAADNSAATPAATSRAATPSATRKPQRLARPDRGRNTATSS